jgi:hypothetical protein
MVTSSGRRFSWDVFIASRDESFREPAFMIVKN